MGIATLGGWMVPTTLFDLLDLVCKVDANAQGGRFMPIGLLDNA